MTARAKPEFLEDGRANPYNAGLYLDFSIHTLACYRSRSRENDKKGPEFIRMGRKIYYYKEALDRWILSFSK